MQYVRFHIALMLLSNTGLIALWLAKPTIPEKLFGAAIVVNLFVGFFCSSLYIVLAKDKESFAESFDFYREFTRTFWEQDERRKRVEGKIIEAASRVIEWTDRIDNLKINGLRSVHPELLSGGKPPSVVFDEVYASMQRQLNVAEVELKELIELVYRASTQFPDLRPRKTDEYLDLAEKRLKEKTRAVPA